jgi:hypothetical protein
MLDPTLRIEHLARLTADEVVRRLAALSPVERVARVVRTLDALAPGLGERFYRLLASRAPADALTFVLAELVTAKVGRIATETMGNSGGLGAIVPPPAVATERDDVAQHNDPPSLKSKAWQEQTYRGLWYPAYRVAIRDLTTHDLGLASAYLGGKLTQRGCPKSDKTRSEEKWNLAYRIVHGIEMVAGAVAGLVLTIIYGPVAGLAVNYLHKAKMALMDRIWKLKVARDPAFRALVAKLQPQGWMSYRGFRFQMRPYGNLLVQELGCGRDLATRLRLHGRILRTIDVLAASAPTVKSRPGGYDYLSAFGLLKGSIFPPRGPAYDGTPAPPKVMAQVNRALASAPIKALINQPAQPAHAALPLPAGLVQSAALLQAEVSVGNESHPDRAPAPAASRGTPPTGRAHAATKSQSSTPLLVLLGGAALGAAILATR